MEMEDSEYFALPRLDQSGLKRFLISPKAYADYVENGLDASPDALTFGTAMHSLVLGSGPDIKERPSLRTKEGKALYAQYKNEGTIMLSKTDRVKALAMFEEPHKYFEGIPGKPEMTLLAVDPASGVELKGKADWLPENPDSDGVYRIRDYKTEGGDLRDFSRAAWRLGYHVQAAFYMRLARLCGLPEPFGFEFVVQEKKRPYDFMVYRMDESSPEIRYAIRRIDQGLARIAKLRALFGDEWVQQIKGMGVDKTPVEVEFPVYALEQEEMEVEKWQ
jgi:hypothetical protein